MMVALALFFVLREGDGPKGQKGKERKNECAEPHTPIPLGVARSRNPYLTVRCVFVEGEICPPGGRLKEDHPLP